MVNKPETADQWRAKFAEDFPHGLVMAWEDEVEDETGGTYPIASVQVTGMKGSSPRVFFVAAVGQGIGFDGTIIEYDEIPDVPQGHRVVFAEWDRPVVWSGAVPDRLWNGFKEAGLL